MARKTLAELKTNPPRLTPEQRARIEAMSEAEIEMNALADLEYPPMTDAQLDSAVFARVVRQTREKLGMTQPIFAERYRITLSRLRDWEQGRYRPDSVSSAYIKTIRHDHEAVDRALASED